MVLTFWKKYAILGSGEDNKGKARKMEEYEKYLKVIKKYNPSEYNDLMNNPYGGIVEDHLDAIMEQYPEIEDFEKALKSSQEK